MTLELLGAFGKSFLFVIAALLPILNPAATAPIFLGLTEGASPATRPERHANSPTYRQVNSPTAAIRP